MRKWSVEVLVAVLAILLGILVISAANEAECNWCPKIICFNDAGCPGGCSCFVPPGESSGGCYGTGAH